MSLRAYRDAVSIYASFELEDLPDADLARLVDSSFVVRIQATVWAGSIRSEVYRDIRQDGLGYEVHVSETGGVHRTRDGKAAWTIASRFNKIELGSIAALSFPLALGCKVYLSLPSDSDYDPMVVWGYKPAAAYRELDSIGLVPYY